MGADVLQWAAVASSIATVAVAFLALSAILQTRRALAETRQQRFDQLKPIISVHYESPPFTLKLRNVGIGPAFNVECYVWCHELEGHAPPWPSNLPWSAGTLAVSEEARLELAPYVPEGLTEPGFWPALANYQDAYGRAFHTLYRAPGDVETQPHWKFDQGRLTLSQAVKQVERMPQ